MRIRRNISLIGLVLITGMSAPTAQVNNTDANTFALNDLQSTTISINSNEPSTVEILSKQIENVSEQIVFKNSSRKLEAASFASLDELASILIAHPEMKASIQGRTSSQETERMNLNLSRVRAKVVLDYLIANGVSADNLTSEGFGNPRSSSSKLMAVGGKKNISVIIESSVQR